MRRRAIAATGAAALAALSILAVALLRDRKGDEPLPIFDAHFHYSNDATAAWTTDQVVEFIHRANLRGALVSSSGNDGTERLREALGETVVAGLRPYRDRGETASWLHDPTIIGYLEGLLATRRYASIGEFHVYGADADLPVMRAVIDLARRYGLWLHAHADSAAIERIYTHDPTARVIWAHAGFADPAEIRRMLDRYPTLVADLAFRSDHYSGARVAPEWRRLFIDHADRFMVGSDTYTPERIPVVVDHAESARRWLADLPREAAAKIAFRNAERIFGREGEP